MVGVLGEDLCGTSVIENEAIQKKMEILSLAGGINQRLSTESRIPPQIFHFFVK